MFARAFGLGAVVAAAGLLQGCAGHRLTVAEPNPYGDYHRVTSNALAWGAIERTSVADKCETNLLSEVRVITSLGQALGTVLTAGFWMPSTVEYKCAKRPPQVGSTDQ